MRSRSEERQRQKRNRIISVTVLLLVVGTSPWWSQELSHVCSRRLMLWNDHFRVNYVVVTGTKILPREAITALAKIPTRHLMFSLPFRDIEKRVTKNPWVKSVQARRRLPDTVELQIVERLPVAAVRGERLMVLTADSVAILPPAEDWVWDLPILSPPRAARMENGERVRDEAVLALLQQTARARSVSPELWKNISELYYSHHQIHAVISHPRTEVIAGKGVSELAWIGLQIYLSQAELDSTGVFTTVDLRIPGKLVASHEAKETLEHGAG